MIIFAFALFVFLLFLLFLLLYNSTSKKSVVFVRDILIVVCV